MIIMKFMIWGFVIFFTTGMFVLISSVIQERKSVIQGRKVVKKNKELEERQDKVEKALKELAIIEPAFSDILKRIGF